MPIHHLHLLVWDVRTWPLVGQVPFLILVAVLYWAGRRRSWPSRSSVLATAAFVAGLSLGTAFLPSVLGAAAGGIALWLRAQRALGLRRPPTAVLALGLARLIAVGRWGCLVNGCCFGILTDLPWAVHYDSSSAAHFLHQALGLLAPDAAHALGVHPYPLYESAGLLLWLPVGFLLLRRLRAEAALLAFTVAFDLGLRGFIDGKRAMINVWWSVLGQWLGFNLFQWAKCSTTTTTSNSSSSSDDSCSGTTTTTSHDRKAVGGWGEVEREIPFSEHSVLWLGGRAGGRDPIWWTGCLRCRAHGIGSSTPEMPSS